MTLSSWRLVKTKYADHPLDGSGARTFGGRWNSVGVAMIYTSSSAALAVLEVLTHLPPLIPLSFQLFEFEFRESLVSKLPLNSYPRGWNQISPPSPLTQSLGDRWIRDQTSAVLQVPSVHVPLGDSYLFNPDHVEFPRIQIVARKDYSFDRRLLEAV